MIGVHAQYAADALLLALGGVVDVAAGLECAGIHPEEGQLAHVGVRHDLEHQGGEGRVVGGFALDLVVLAGAGALHRRDVDGGGQVVHDGVQQGLHALVAIGGAAQHGRHAARDGGLADAAHDLFMAELPAVQVLLHQLVVGLGGSLHHLAVVLLGHLAEIGGDVGLVHGGAHLVDVDLGLHLDQVHQAHEAGLGADGDLDRHGVGLEPLLHHADHAEEVRAHDVHLVDVSQAGHVVLVGLAPDRLGLGLDAALGAEDAHGAVQHAQGALDLHGKVHVARGVDQVDLVAAPFTGRGRRGDRDAALLLLFHPVHRGHALVDLADAMRTAGVVQDALGSGGLAGIDVRHDADVAYMIQ